MGNWFLFLELIALLVSLFDVETIAFMKFLKAT